MSTAPTYEERTKCEEVLFEWAESYDSKDWARLAAIIAPALTLGYPGSHGAIPAKQFLKMVSGPSFLGNQLIKTQHFMGAGRWRKTSPNAIEGVHQARVAHQRYKDQSFQEIAAKGHDHGNVTTFYELVDGEWKFAGLRPLKRWSEYDRDNIFV